jgi:hypothetical protein
VRAGAHAEAAAALGRGDALRALGLTGTLEDGRALLLRGIAYAQMGDLPLARRTLERAMGAGAGDRLIVARAHAALAEIELAAGKADRALGAARRAAVELERLGDRRNAAMQRLVVCRARVLLGDLDGAWRELEDAPRELEDVAELVRAEVAMRRVDAGEAARALDRARRSPHALLARAASATALELVKPIARLSDRGVLRAVSLAGVEEASSGDAFLLDACRRLVRAGRATIPLARRPILFELLLALVSSWPHDVERDELARRVFGARRPNESHRVRLRVEVSRLRKALEGIATLEPTSAGYALSSPRPVLLLLPLTHDDGARLAILLSDGAAWSAQELAEHAGLSKRTVQRALAALVADGRALRTGGGKDTRYAGAGGPIASRMLLLALVPAS